MTMNSKDGRVADGEQALVNHAPADHGPSGFDPSRITDRQLAEACCPGEPREDQDAFLAALSDQHRETLKRLIWVGDELNAGRVPQGVLI